MSVWRTKPVSAFSERPSGLARTLGTLDLTLLGIGAIVGAGIFVLTGVAAATHAGPAVVVSFIVAGLACTFAALSYAELAATVGGAGSAYGYAYAGFGEIAAWLIGWDLILEYSVAAAAVAVGWSGYVTDVLASVGITMPVALRSAPGDGGLVNLPAALVILVLGSLLALGVRASARFNAAIVAIKLVAIAVFITVAVGHIDVANWANFAPFGWSGIMGGAAIVFFAFIGFDAVSTAAEEARDPQHGLPRGIVYSLAICTGLYVIVAALLTLVASYTALNVASPVSSALLGVGIPWAASIVAAGAIAGLTSVILVLYYGQTRIFWAMAQDRLLPAAFGVVSPRTRTPVAVILLCGVVVGAVAGLVPLGEIVELVNIGTLAAFVLVCLGVLRLRVTQPDLHRPFRVPFGIWIPLAGASACVYLMFNLPAQTWWRFVIWMSIGVAIYFSYSKTHSRLEPGAR